MSVVVINPSLDSWITVYCSYTCVCRELSKRVLLQTFNSMAGRNSTFVTFLLSTVTPSHPLVFTFTSTVNAKGNLSTSIRGLNYRKGLCYLVTLNITMVEVTLEKVNHGKLKFHLYDTTWCIFESHCKVILSNSIFHSQVKTED